MRILKKLMINYSGWGFIFLSFLIVALLLARAYQRVGEVERDDILKQTNLNLEDGIHVRLSSNKEDGKPEILTKEGYPVLNYSHKDSVLRVDGVNYNLWDMAFNYSVDRRNKTIFYTVSSPEDKLKRSFIVEETIKLTDKNTASISYYFVHDAPENIENKVNQVELVLAHYNSGLGGLSYSDNLIKGQSQINLRRSSNKDAPNSYTPFEVKTSPNVRNPNLEFRKNDLSTSNEIVPGFLTTYVIQNPSRGQRVLIATEQITLEKPFP